MATLGQELRRNPDVLALLILWLLLGLGGTAAPRGSMPLDLRIPAGSSETWKSPVRTAVNSFFEMFGSSTGDCLMHLEF